jgi:indole-3-glycerol phosphate synthase
MSTILDRIKAYKLEEVAKAKAAVPLADLEAAAKSASPAARLCPRPARGGADRLWPDRRDQEGQPLQGPDPRRFRPARLARAYQAGGATCLSVLTDGPSFQGADDDS